MAPQADFPIVFEKLKSILKPYEKKLTVTANSSGAYSLDGLYSEKWKQNVFFGSTQIKKIYVSFYLMPVYMYPDLLKGISPELKKRMQGKSCFNFKQVDQALFRELTALTKKGFERFQKEEMK